MACVLNTVLRKNQHQFLGATSPHGQQKRMQGNIFCHRGYIDQGITLRESRPATKIQPAFVGPDVSDVRYPTFIRCFRGELNCRLSLLGATILASALRVHGLRYPTLAFIPARVINLQTWLISQCCPLSRKSRWILL